MTVLPRCSKRWTCRRGRRRSRAYVLFLLVFFLFVASTMIVVSTEYHCSHSIFLLFLFGTVVVHQDTGPDALTQAYGKAIPRTCIAVPYYETTMERCYYTYVPDPASAACRSSTTNVVTENDVRLLPLVFDIHGLTGCPLFQASWSGTCEIEIIHCT